jgi:hypothetical protein
MKRLYTIVKQLVRGISKAVLRFPLTVLSLVVAASLVCYLISLRLFPAPLLVEKGIFALAVGALVGMAAQFSTERFAKLAGKRPLVYLVALVLTAGYFWILWPAPEIGSQIVVRSFVAIFALFCYVLFIPAYRKATDFDRVALVHFKSFFTAALYSGVLSAGLAAIIFAIDTLLFNVNENAYGYMMAIVWIVFAPVYYLSLLPNFNESSEEAAAIADRKSEYPRFLEILISYIAVPLFSAYTLVLIAYFFKILVTRQWPSGQLGPMVLVYSAVGILLFILCALPKNRFVHWYRMLFPKILIPVVIMQMIAVWIRLDAYGITESRYYIALFGIYSIVTGVFLSLRPNGRNGVVVLLSAAFAIVSILPPVDAFTVSRNSQINILETYLEQEGILSSDGTLTPKSEVPEDARVEITAKLDYLTYSGSSSYIEWLPEDFVIYEDFEKTFGFVPAYRFDPGIDNQYFHAEIDARKPVDIRGYDVSIPINAGKYGARGISEYPFSLDGQDYILRINTESANEVTATVVDGAKMPVVTTGFYDFALSLKDEMRETKQWFSPESLSLEVENNGYKMKVVFQWIDLVEGDERNAGVEYMADVYFAAP